MGPTLKDFFKKKPTSSPSGTPASVSIKTSPAKRLASDSSDEFQSSSHPQPEQKLRRSAKSMVTSNKAAAAAAVDLTGTTPVKPEAAAIKSPRRTPVKSVKSTPVKSAKSSPVRAAPVKTPKITEDDEDIFEPPAPATPSAEQAPKKNFNYRDYLQRKNAVPAALGSKEIPEGAPNCLEGLAFVFTGDLASITRDQAQDLVKRYAGRVTTAPSKKTSYVVVGENPGPSKMDKIKALGLATLTEDGFLDLIRQSNPTGAPAPAAPAVVATVKPKEPMAAKAAAGKSKVQPKTDTKPGSDLWTVRYAPSREDELIGNHSIYEKLKEWLDAWKAGSTENKAALLSGPPGIGKTTMASLACKELGFDAVEFNASDTRSKKTLHETVREMIDTTTLRDARTFFDPHKAAARKHVLIMDEVDGMSAGDRGGMAELILLIKRSRIPIVCICNDRASPKVRSLANHCLDLRFRRPDARQIVPRIKAIAEAEGLTVQPNALEELVASTHSDIRQILNLLSTYKLTKETLSYDNSKALTIGSAKDVEQGPFEATSNLLGGQAWSRMSVGEKIDQYFIDSSLVPLMIQENYLKCKANNPRTVISTRNPKPTYLDLAAAAADSLSLSDRVDSLIRGSNQEWSLAPMHAIMTSVLPAYYVHGAMGGRIDFAGWLGQNSRTMKNQRLLTELTIHTFLHTRAGKLELRLDYWSPLTAAILRPLMSLGQEGIEPAIAFMDDYSISRDDIDTLLDISLNPSLNAAAFAKIPAAVKSAFTRKYNQGVHRLPYSLGGASTGSVKRISTDIEAAAGSQEDDIIYDAVDDEDDGEDEDVTKSKMVKAKTSKAPKKAATKGKTTRK